MEHFQTKKTPEPLERRRSCTSLAAFKNKLCRVLRSDRQRPIGSCDLVMPITSKRSLISINQNLIDVKHS